MEKKTHILLVDDEQDITSNLAAYLNRSGFETPVAGDGEKALQKVEQNPPDLIVLDVLMPRVDRREVLRQLRQADDWTTVILQTQVGKATVQEIAMQGEAYNHLNQLFDLNELGVRQRTGLRHSHPSRAPLRKAVLCISFIAFVMIGCTTRPSMVAPTPERLPINCIPTDSTERFIVSNRQMSLTVIDIEVAIEQVEKIITEYGGYVDQEQTQVYRSTGASFTVRLPRESFGEASDKVMTVAKEINDEWAIGQDITEQYADLEHQLCTLEGEYNALSERIARDPANHLSDQLVNLDSEIEHIRGKIVYRDERLALATLTLHISSE
jgi:DNA-binding response OmpR family regulator